MSVQESILNVEEIDIQIAKLESSKLEYPKKLKELKDNIAQEEKELFAAKESMEKIEKNIASANIDLETHKNELAKSHDRLNSVKNNKEYDAVLREIRERKTFIESTSRDIIKLKEKLPQIQEEFKTKQADFDKVKSENTPNIEDLTQKISSIDNDISLKIVEKEKLLPSIPQNYLNIYDSILPGRKNSGRVLSLVYPKRKTCGYCNQVLSPNIMGKISMKKAPIVCENCGSLFVFIDKSE
ncbi:MAG: hypothetical protein LBH98_00970 [Chitinispirillales bacterium]|jgi:predicted  nucleic acid-binding Zn-ribbon protein|nr:hypothetical protein [Chitinispirillales bacterium]